MPKTNNKTKKIDTKINYVFNLQVAIDLNLLIVKENPRNAYGIEIMKESYNDYYNFEEIDNNKYYLYKKIDNLLVHKINLPNGEYLKKLKLFKKKNFNDYSDIINRVLYLKEYINNFTILKNNCPKLFNLTKQYYSEFYNDLIIIKH